MTTDHDRELAAMVTEQAGRLFANEVTRATLEAADRGEWPQALWAEVQQAGLPQALTPEAHGGTGLGGALAFSLVRLAAFHAAALPLGETMVAGALWAAAGGAAEDDAPLAIADAPELTLARGGGGWQLSGHLQSVPFASNAQAVLACASDAEGKQWLVRIGVGAVQWTAGRNLANEPRDDAELRALALATDAVLPAPALLRSAGMRPIGALVRAQQLVGAMERCLEMALAYAGERVQFGRRIGSFAPVQNMLAEVAGQIAAAAGAADGAAEAWDAALLADASSEGFVFAVAAAKSRAGEAAGSVAALCHQVHGAIGFTQEHLLHHFTRRLWSWRDEFGGESHWNAWLGQRICARGGAAMWPTITSL